MQMTLFIGVIETKFENPRKGLEALFKNLFCFFADIKTREDIVKRKRKVENDGSAILHFLDSFEHISRFLGL